MVWGVDEEALATVILSNQAPLTLRRKCLRSTVPQIGPRSLASGSSIEADARACLSERPVYSSSESDGLRFLDAPLVCDAAADRSNDEKSHFVGSVPGKRSSMISSTREFGSFFSFQ